MERDPKPFQASRMAQDLVRRFGTSGEEIRVPMRPCDDVPRFVRRIEQAHLETAKSSLRFGPPPSQLPPKGAK